ncbi:MAG TPA: hypothetical protein DC049_18615, partial [Spirochaetia bacterium]|nr:hypothetical protein [Spirochaetia bacterium]
MKKYEKQFIPDYFFILDNICKIKNKTSQYTENNKLKSKGFDNCFTVYFALIKIINDLLPIYPNAILEKDPNDNNIFGVYLSTSNIEIQKTCKNRI